MHLTMISYMAYIIHWILACTCTISTLVFQRLDGRDTYDYRKVRITYDTERGCCEVQVGETRFVTF